MMKSLKSTSDTRMPDAEKIRAGFLDLETVDVDAITALAQDNDDEDYTAEVEHELNELNDIKAYAFSLLCLAATNFKMSFGTAASLPNWKG